jgi:dihydropteroate synthase
MVGVQVTDRLSARVADLPTPDRCLVMGVLNVTPDSFSDGGEWLEPSAAVDHGRRMIADGADLIDVGGESTRPGALRSPVDEELRRVLPVVRELAADGVIVSIDTMRAEVAEKALDAGARVINDVSGGRADPRMFSVAADANVPYIVMHWRRHSSAMDDAAHYDDVVADVMAELRPQVEAAIDAGVAPEHLAIDPGLGFSKHAEHNWTLLRRLHELFILGYPVLVGASRKRFLGALLGTGPDDPRPAGQRDDATVAVTTLAAAAGAWCVRVHDVRPNADAVRVVRRWADG